MYSWPDIWDSPTDSDGGNKLFLFIGDFNGDREGEGETSPGGYTVTGRNPRRLWTKSRCFKEPMTFLRRLLAIALLQKGQEEGRPYMRKHLQTKIDILVVSCCHL